MNLKEIIEATLIELDRGTAPDTVELYTEKFTMYANEAVDEIARRFKVCTLNYTELQGNPVGFDISSSDFDHACKRIVRVLPATVTESGGVISFTTHFDKRPYEFKQIVHGTPYIHVWGNDAKAGDEIAVEYLYVPNRMNATSIEAGDPDVPDIPEYMHSLIPLYVRAREQCGQDPSTQGLSNAYFSLFNKKVYDLQRETMATPDSFQFKGYHFE